ncbi:hypothetical protein M3Y97_00443500 [Aphelenchoides bicaudatus]|nr:hypothetical protein M3Y97_00443500 [Aphelenchoides bicaudatus]
MQIMQVDRGIVVKSLDTRHLDWHEGRRLISDAITRPCKNEALKSRLSLIDSSDPFGLNDLQVNYSLSKKKRWLLTSHFEQNAETYQRPDLKVSTVLATSEFPSIFGSDDHEMFKNSRGWNADEASHVKCLISCDTQGPDWRKHVKVSKKYSSRILDPLQLEIESLDFDVDGSFDEEDTEGQKPSTLTIGDFVQPQTTKQSNRTSSESDYEFVIAGIQHGLSLDDYDFSD